MGLVYVEGVVKRGERSVRVRFLMDSGATYTVLSEPVWRSWGSSRRARWSSCWRTAV